MKFFEGALPLLVHVSPPEYSDALVHELIEGYEGYFRRGERYALFNFSATDTALNSPRHRKQITDWAETPRVREASRRLCVGSSTLVSNAIMRGAMTAVLWFWKPASPHVCVASPEEGIDWCLEALARAGVPFARGREEARSVALTFLRAERAKVAGPTSIR